MDDHEIFLLGLRAALDDVPEFDIVGAHSGANPVLIMVKKTKPDIVIMDISIFYSNYLKDTGSEAAGMQSAKIICLSGTIKKNQMRRVLSGGAAGLLAKECPVEELIFAIRSTHHSGAFLSPAVTPAVIEGYLRGTEADDAGRLSKLTARERETLELIVAGHPTKSIANLMSVSVKTIGTYREHLMEKLEIYSIAGLTKYAIRNDITSVDPI